MSGFTFRPAKRENVPLLIGIAGGTGSGKTFSALRVATGLAGGKRFAGIDTEAGRMKHYADQFNFDHADFAAPFNPLRYLDAIVAADAAHYPVIVVDSASHEHAGDGGILDMQEAEFQRLGAREAVKMLSWVKPKGEHRKLVSKLLQIRAHLILCFRAEEKIEMVKVGERMEVRKKVTATGLDGWVPICEKTLPYELTASFLLLASKPGIPMPIKLQEQHRRIIDLSKPLDETAGRLLAEWARGGAVGLAPTIASVTLGPQRAHETAPGTAPESGLGVSPSKAGEEPARGPSDYVAQERMAWLAQIDKAAKGLGLTEAGLTVLWNRHCGQATKQNADPTQLEQLHAAIVKRAKSA